MSVQFVGLIKADITDRNSAGSISVTGLKVGDKLIASYLQSNGQWTEPGVQFEAVISVDDEIQQVGNITVGSVLWDLVLVR